MKLNWKNLLLVTVVIISSCSTNEEFTHNTSPALETIPEPIEVDLNDSRYLLAKHVSNDQDVEVFFLELGDEVVTSIQYNLDGNLDNLHRYLNILNRAREENTSLDRLYADMAGASADSRSMAKLKLAQEALDSRKNSTIETLTEEQAQVLIDRFERHANERNEALGQDRNTSDRTAACATSTTSRDWFNNEICNGTPVQYCFQSWGPSTAPSFTGEFYRIYVFNPYVAGDVTANAYVGSSKSTFIFSVKPNKIEIHDFWGPMQTRVSRVSNDNPNCGKVAHAVLHALRIFA